MIDATEFPAPEGFADMPAEYQQHWTEEWREYQYAIYEALQKAPAIPVTAWDHDYVGYLISELEGWKTHTVTDVHELVERATAHANLRACKAAAAIGKEAGALLELPAAKAEAFTVEDLARTMASWAFLDQYVVDPRPIGDITPAALAAAADTYSEAHWEEHIA